MAETLDTTPQPIAEAATPLAEPITLPSIKAHKTAPVLVVRAELIERAATFIPLNWGLVGWRGHPRDTSWTSLGSRPVVVVGSQADAKALRASVPTAIAATVAKGADQRPDEVRAYLAALVPTPAPKKANGHDTAPPAAYRRIIDPISWHGMETPVRQWIVRDLIPKRVVTMLSGDGGIGKSTLGLQLGVACATGTNWLDRVTQPMRVLVVACEDDDDELHLRTRDIVESCPGGLNLGDLENLRIIPGVGEDNILVDFPEYGGVGAATKFCDFVEQQAEEFGAQLIILDSLHDFFGGNENLRPQARQFINRLRRIALARDGAVLLLAHPSQSGMMQKTGSAGSTAWNNTVRSRLYLTRPDAGQDEPAADYLVLKTMKANYGPSGGEIRLKYRSGYFWPLDGAKEHEDPVARKARCEAAFLSCLKAANARGQWPTESKYGKYAPKLFATMDSVAQGFSRDEFAVAMQRLLNVGKLIVDSRYTGNRNSAQVLIEVTHETAIRQDDDISDVTDNDGNDGIPF